MNQTLRILMTNNALALPAGSEIYLRDLAVALVRRGHFPVAYSPLLGDVAAALRAATVPVVDRLADLNVAPDIIHGHHHLEAMGAMLHFHGVPAVFACHGWAPWEETPPVFPAIRRYVAVDDLCRERLYATPGIRPEHVEVIYNFIDLSRFRPRDELPSRPRTAVVFSNYASEGKRLETIRRACARFGIAKVEVAGFGSGRVVAKPEAFLRRYDLVFAKARCALEALATGAAVIVADFSGLGGMVTTGNMYRMRALNFGVRTMQADPITDETLLRELEKYDCQDAARVTEWIRLEADLEAAVDRWLAIYREVLSDSGAHGSSRDHGADMRAAAAYLGAVSEKIKTLQETERDKSRLQTALRDEKVMNKSLQKKIENLEMEIKALKDAENRNPQGFIGTMKRWLRRHSPF